MRIFLIIYMVMACNTGRVTFNPGDANKENEDKSADNTPKVGSVTQKIDPIITNRPLDILLVIDNSSSMNRVHENLSNNLSPLLQKVRDSDWRIVITTATFTDCLRAVINKGDNNYNAIFINTISELKNRKLQGRERSLSNTEDTVRMATKALPTVSGSQLQYNLPLRSLGHRIADEGNNFHLTRPTWCTGDVNHQDNGQKTAHWLRDESMLAILLITDEDAYSGDGIGLDCGCDFNEPVRSCRCIDDLWRRISALRKPKIDAKIYGLLSSVSDHYLKWRSADGQQLFDYHQQVDASGNTQTNNFASVLDEISTNVAEQMHKTYSLNRSHDGKTSEVTFVYSDKSRKKQTSYKIEGRTLIFNENPPSNVKEIEVSFSYSH